MRTFALALLIVFAAGMLGCPGRIVEYPEKSELSKEEIKAALTGDDFRRKNAAREQLGKLTPAEQLEVLTALLKEGDAPTRMLAMSELMNLPEESTKPLLEEVAANDPDEEVREMAAMALGADDEGDEADDEGDEEAPMDEPADESADDEAATPE